MDMGFDLQEINHHGVTRMRRLLAVLQPGLSALGSRGGRTPAQPQAVRAFDRARTYYGLLTLPADALVKVAIDKPQRFSPAEYQAILQV